jgi:hypothetical protein
LNSKAFTLVTLLTLLASCGIKSPPVAPAGTEIPSYEEKFLKPTQVAGEEKNKEEEENKKKKQQKQ